MHADMSPLAPFRPGNGHRRLITYDSLNLFCLASGLLGLALWAIISSRKSRTS